MAAPNLTFGIREAEVQMDTVGADSALQGDYLQLTGDDRGRWPVGTGKGCPGKVAHHAQHKTGGIALTGELLECEPHIAASFEMERSSAHGWQGWVARPCRLNESTLAPPRLPWASIPHWRASP